jgi:predicted 3-demethylubiquinone-9 3-methyltransferase (glyoxalase superfamily)
MHTVHPCLWFDAQAEEAAAFYLSIFEDSRIMETMRYLEGSPGETGAVMAVRFVLNGEEIMALNGGPAFAFTPAVSIVVHCQTQAEIDHYWESLTAGGEEGQCGWLTDKFGVSWQIVSDAMLGMLGAPDRAAAQRAFTAMLSMTKLDIARLEQAFSGA